MANKLYKLFLLACALAALWAWADLAKAEPVTMVWTLSQPILVGPQTATEIVLMADSEDMQNPYFAIVGGFTAYSNNGIRVTNEPVSGSCRASTVAHLCGVHLDTYPGFTARIYIRGSTRGLFVTESAAGEQGPVDLIPMAQSE